ncbi:RluA family pseudouridine synthase [Gracilibacillus caseinilyticus]|uniref:RNA pseudouridylate synthase n=1 Tax=Gracilibacillus caseinilyticus TaxID=2932256 RepID=A0ABY4EXY6_9BACI|nr:RluA family pseudouridine synthase [Gracilibacillus caseinilyticus]UOQ47021.1 RluA family pseudouridine synthase [Gracilibacillus caseinilyticus]
MSIEILYEDNHLLMVEKPVNLPVQQDQSNDDDLLNILKDDIKYRYQKPGNVYLGLVHRLDRPVGGAMVFAKTSKAASRLSDTIRKNEIDKTYLAVVRGVPDEATGYLVDYLVKDKKRNKVSVTSSQTKQAKKAELGYELLASENGLSLVKIHLYTGRPHQIRVQFASRNMPLFGDQKYGSKQNKPGQQISLWSHRLRFYHPVRQEEISKKSFPPDKYPWSKWNDILYA